MQHQKTAHERRRNRSRGHIARLGAVRLSVQRTAQHIYAQIFAPGGGEVLAHASSVEAGVRDQKANLKGKISLAELVGKLVAERARAKGIDKVAFDRSGYRYHGRVKALADAARANGLEF